MEDKTTFVSLSLIRVLDENLRLTNEKFPRLKIDFQGLDYESDEDSSSDDQN